MILLGVEAIALDVEPVIKDVAGTADCTKRHKRYQSANKRLINGRIAENERREHDGVLAPLLNPQELDPWTQRRHSDRVLPFTPADRSWGGVDMPSRQQ